MLQSADLALLRRRLLLAGIPLAVLALLVTAWILDARAHDGEALRNVEVAGHRVGGLGGDALTTAVEEVAGRYAEATVMIVTPDGELEAAAADLGLALDVEGTVERALAAGRRDALPMRPLRWLRSLVGAREAGVVVDVDRDKVRFFVGAEDPTARREPREPGIVGDSGEIAVVLGEAGEGLDAAEVADAIESAGADGRLPIVVEVAPTTIQPRFSREDAEALARTAEELTASSLAVSAGGKDVSIPPGTVRTWLRSDAGPEGLELRLDGDRVLADLRDLLGDVGTSPQNARFTVEGGRPRIIPGEPGRTCCDETAVGYLLGAVKAGNAGPVTLPLTELEPDQSTAALEALGIVEEIGSFTTRHDCCQGRVTNIHRIADIVRGVVIRPGAQFSVNEFVGRRTAERGFVEGGVIQNGVFETSIGGGISQFATTLFNAAFFGGLDFVEYQSHSIYISRYPYGREATLSFPKPDLVLRNSTPHGVLVWPTYTGTTITVTLYSTTYAKGEQTAQSEAPVGQAGCKRVTTTRTRTYRDGRTETDRVHAVYRPAEGVRCDGPPPTTTTTTAPEPEPEPEPSPDPDPSPEDT